jgi:hypothetical protein
MIRRLAIAVLLTCAASAVTAQPILRTIPDDAKRGVMSHVQGMTVLIAPVEGTSFNATGVEVDIAAGAQIRDGRNMIVVPSAVPPNTVVRYQLNPDGKVRRAWILSPQEAAQPDPKK